jgi:hypothetical protein
MEIHDQDLELNNQIKQEIELIDYMGRVREEEEKNKP